MGNNDREKVRGRREKDVRGKEGIEEARRSDIERESFSTVYYTFPAIFSTKSTVSTVFTAIFLPDLLPPKLPLK